MKNRFLSLVILCCGFSLHAQTLKTPAASPTQTLKQNFALSDISVEYSRPSVKGRVIFGDLVPFDKVWRTGANSATKITFGEDVQVEGTAVKAGSYALYTVPGKDAWDIMLYNDLTLGGNVGEYKKENELLRIKAKPTMMADKVEMFTIGVNDVTPKTARIELMWDKTKVGFNVSTEIDERIMKNIESVMSKDARPFQQAANYYYENDKDLTKALEWARKAFEANPKAYWSANLIAKIQYKMKDYKGALVSAEKALEVAKAEKSDEYIKQNEKLIADIKKAK